MKSKLVIASLFVLTAGAVVAFPHVRRDATETSVGPPVAAPAAMAPVALQPAVALVAPARPRIDVVFALDTTGSMGGLIQAAKEDIWAIATRMASAQPAPELRMGLVAFRDRGDDYVTRRYELTADLDSMYARLMDFKADGGGDGPESVNQALHEAVTKMAWSEGDSVYRVVFLVGDAPPHMDYQDDVKYPQTLAIAKSRGIVVNAIQAGSEAATMGIWQQIASLNQGRYFKVGQDGDALAIAAPQDTALAELSKELDGTRLYYGDEHQKVAMAAKVAATDKLHAAGSIAARAKRAEFNASAAGASNRLGENELVDDIAKGKVDLAKLDAKQLPDALKGLDRAAQSKQIEETLSRRKDLESKIAKLGAERRAYVEGEMKKRAEGATSLDEQIFSAVKEQASARGLSYEPLEKK